MAYKTTQNWRELGARAHDKPVGAAKSFTRTDLNGDLLGFQLYGVDFYFICGSIEWYDVFRVLVRTAWRI